MTILGIIPARGGSKTVADKNIKLICGKPLIAFAIEEAKKSKFIDRVVVSTDYSKIAEVAIEYGAEVPFIRPGHLAGDYVTDLPVFEHCLCWLKENNGYSPEIVAHLRPTAPLRTTNHIDEGIKILLDSEEADSVRSVCVAPKNPLKMWKINGKAIEPFIPESFSGIKEAYNFPRQKLPEAYVQNGSVDIIRSETILQKRSMTGDTIFHLIMDEDESINIDTELDFIVAEQLMKKRLE